MADKTAQVGAAYRHSAPIHSNLPGGIVITRRDPWIIDDIAIAGLTSMLSGISSIEGLGAGGVFLAASTGAAAIAARSTYGIWRNHRQVLTTQLMVTLARELDMGVRIRMYRWRGGPRALAATRVSIRYPIERSIDAMLPAQLADLCGRTLGSRFVVADHDKAKGYIRFRRVTPDREIEQAEQQVTFDRGCNIVRQLLGETATIEPKHDQRHQLVAFEIKHKAGVRVANPSRRAHIERVCTTMLPGRWRAKWSLETDEVRLELRPNLKSRVPHVPKPITDENYWHLPFALDEDGNVIYWDLASSSPHHMTCGKTGTGKTVEIRTIITEATRRGWPVWIIDPKRVEFMDMREWPNVQIVATRVVEMIAVIIRAWREMEDRYARIERREVRPSELEPLVLVLDEYRDFFGMVSSWWQQVKNTGHPNRCPVFEAVSSIARKGRTARVHVVLGTQRPDAEFLSGEMRDNFDSRTSLGPLSPQGAQMMWEASYIGVAIPRKVRGRATSMDSDGRPVEVQVMWTPEPGEAESSGNEEDLALLAALRPAEASHRPLMVHVDEDWLHEDRCDPKTGRPRLYDAIRHGDLVEFDPDKPPPSFEFGDIADLAPAVLQAPDEPIDDIDGLPDLDADYDQPEPVRTDGVIEGDLIEVGGSWVVVESVLPDPLKPSEIAIDWRSFDDQSGSMVMSDEEQVEIRRPFADVEATPPQEEVFV